MRDHGWLNAEDVSWQLACCRRVADWLPRLEIISLDLGLLLSLYASYRIALAQSFQQLATMKLRFIRRTRALRLNKVDTLIPLGVASKLSKPGGQHVHQFVVSRLRHPGL